MMWIQETFSILHPTIRLGAWKTIAQEWIKRADQPEKIEYVLCVDRPIEELPVVDVAPATGCLIANRGRHCYVDAMNTAAQAAGGKVLVCAADDWFPCPHWDTLLRDAIGDLHREAVVEVDNGHHPNIIIYPILTRSYYERPGRGGCPNGELFYPEYLSMGADDEFTEYARQDGVVIQAKQISFEQRHPWRGAAEMDDAYRHVQSEAAWTAKDRVLPRRRADGFRK